MTVSYLMNTIDRFDITPAVTKKNQSNAGRPINRFIITDNGSEDQRIKRWAGTFAHKYIENAENIGNAQAFNNALDLVNTDIIVIAGNDIELPHLWLSEAIKMLADPKVGLIGYNWRGKAQKYDGEYGQLNLPVKGGNVFGTWVFHKRLFKKLGYLNEWSKYGLWDGAYCKRAEDAGFINGYLKGLDSKHLGEDVGEDSEYRKMKNREMKKAKKGFTAYTKGRPDNYYYGKT